MLILDIVVVAVNHPPFDYTFDNMCGALLTFMLKMIYWNFQTKLSDHELCEEAWPGSGRCFGGAEQPETNSAVKVHSSR